MEGKSYQKLLKELLLDTSFGRCVRGDGTVGCFEKDCPERVALPEDVESTYGFRIASGSEEKPDKFLVAWCPAHARQKTPVFCECKTSYSYTTPEDFLVSCDECSEWFHGKCVGVDEDDGAAAEYVCRNCRKLRETGSVLSPTVKLANLEKDRISEEMKQAIVFFQRVDTLRLWIENVSNISSAMDEETLKAAETQIQPLNLSLQRWVNGLPDTVDHETIRQHLDMLSPVESNDEEEEDDDEESVMVLAEEEYPLSSYGVKDVTCNAKAELEQLLRDVDDWEDSAVDLVTRLRLICKSESHVSEGSLKSECVPKLQDLLQQMTSRLARRPRKLVVPKRAEILAISGDSVKWLINAFALSAHGKPTSAEVSSVVGQAKSWNVESLAEVSPIFKALTERAKLPSKWLSRYAELLRASSTLQAVKILGSTMSLDGDFKGVEVQNNTGTSVTIDDILKATADMEDMSVRVLEKEELIKALGATQAWETSFAELALRNVSEPGSAVSDEKLLADIEILCRQLIIPVTSLQETRQRLSRWFEAVRWNVLSKAKESPRYSQSTLRKFLEDGKQLFESVEPLLKNPESAHPHIKAAFEELRVCIGRLEASFAQVESSPARVAAIAKLQDSSILKKESRDQVVASMSALHEEPFITPEEEAMQLVADLEGSEGNQAVLLGQECTIEQLGENQTALTQTLARIETLNSVMPGDFAVLKALKARFEAMLQVVVEKIAIGEKLATTATNAVRTIQNGEDHEGKYTKSALETLLTSLETSKLVLKPRTMERIKELVAIADLWEAKAQELLAKEIGRSLKTLTDYKQHLDEHARAARQVPHLASTFADVKAASEIVGAAMTALRLVDGNFDSGNAKPLLKEMATKLEEVHRWEKTGLVSLLCECFCDVAVWWVGRIVSDLKSPSVLPSAVPSAPQQRKSSTSLLGAQKFLVESSKSLPSPCAQVAERLAEVPGYSELMTELTEHANFANRFRASLKTAEASLRTDMFLDENDTPSPVMGNRLLLTNQTVRETRLQLSKTSYKMAEEERCMFNLHVINCLASFYQLVLGMSPSSIQSGPQIEIQQLRYVLRELAAIHPSKAPLGSEMGPIFPEVDFSRLCEYLSDVEKQASEYITKAAPMLVVRMTTRAGQSRRASPRVHVGSIVEMLAKPIVRKVKLAEAKALVELYNGDRALATRVHVLLKTNFFEQGEPLEQSSSDRQVAQEDVARLRDEFNRVNEIFGLRAVTSPERVVTEFLTELLESLTENYKSLSLFKDRMEKIGKSRRESQEGRMGILRAEKYITELRKFFIDIPADVVNALKAMGVVVEEKAASGSKQFAGVQSYSDMERPVLRKSFVFSGAVSVCVKVASESINLLVLATNLVRQWSEKASRFLSAASAMDKATREPQVLQILQEESVLPVRAGKKLTEQLKRIVQGPSAVKSSEDEPAGTAAEAARSKRPPLSKTVIPMPKQVKAVTPAPTRMESFESDKDAEIEPTVYYPCTRSGCPNKAMKYSAYCGDVCASKKKDQMMDTLLCWWKEDGSLFNDLPNFTRVKDFNAPALKASFSLLEEIHKDPPEGEVSEGFDSLRRDLQEVQEAKVVPDKKPNPKRAKVRDSMIPVFAKGLHEYTDLANRNEVLAAAGVVAWDFEMEVFTNARKDGDTASERPEDEKYSAKYRRLRYALEDRTKHVLGQIVNGGKTMKEFVMMQSAGLQNLSDFKLSIVQKLEKKLQEKSKPTKSGRDESSRKRPREAVEAKDGEKKAKRRQEKRPGGAVKPEMSVKKEEEGTSTAPTTKKSLSIKTELGGSVDQAEEPPSSGKSSPATPTGRSSPKERKAIRSWSDHVEAKQESPQLEKLPTTYVVEYKGFAPFQAEIFVTQDELGAEDMLRTPLRLQGRVRLQAVSSFLDDIRAGANRRVYHIRANHLPGEEDERNSRALMDMLLSNARCGVAEFDKKTTSVYLVPAKFARTVGFRGATGGFPWVGFVITKKR